MPIHMVEADGIVLRACYLSHYILCGTVSHGCRNNAALNSVGAKYKVSGELTVIQGQGLGIY